MRNVILDNNRCPECELSYAVLPTLKSGACIGAIGCSYMYHQFPNAELQ